MNMACAYALLGWTLNVELLGYRACTFSILIDISQLVSRVTIPIYIPTRRPSLILDMVVVVCVCVGGELWGAKLEIIYLAYAISSIYPPIQSAYKEVRKEQSFPDLIPEKFCFYLILLIRWKNLRLGRVGIDLLVSTSNTSDMQLSAYSQ